MLEKLRHLAAEIGANETFGFSQLTAQAAKTPPTTKHAATA
jgi:hypothetical protein